MNLLFAMSTPLLVSLIVLGVFIILLVVLFILGKRMDKKQQDQQALMENYKQNVSMLVIDKKKVRFKDAGFPQSVIDQAPKMSKFMKVYVVKAKVGPQIITFICDDKIYDSVPVKKEVKAVISGMYIMSVKGLHGKTEVAPPKKKNAFKRAIDKLQEKAGAKPVK